MQARAIPAAPVPEADQHFSGAFAKTLRFQPIVHGASFARDILDAHAASENWNAHCKAMARALLGSRQTTGSFDHDPPS